MFHYQKRFNENVTTINFWVSMQFHSIVSCNWRVTRGGDNANEKLLIIKLYLCENLCSLENHTLTGAAFTYNFSCKFVTNYQTFHFHFFIRADITCLQTYFICSFLIFNLQLLDGLLIQLKTCWQINQIAYTVEREMTSCLLIESISDSGL